MAKNQRKQLEITKNLKTPRNLGNQLKITRNSLKIPEILELLETFEVLEINQKLSKIVKIR